MTRCSRRMRTGSATRACRTRDPAKHWTVALWARNLADEDYLVGAYDLAAFGFDQYVVGAPRTYGITLSYRL